MKHLDTSFFYLVNNNVQYFCGQLSYIYCILLRNKQDDDLGFSIFICDTCCIEMWTFKDLDAK